MYKHNDQQFLISNQYKDASNLDARIQLHRFSANKQGLPNWIFDHFDLPNECDIIELGCGTGGLWKSNADRIPQGWNITLTDFSPGIIEKAEANLTEVPHDFQFETVDAQSIPYEDHSFDAIIANHMLYHVPDRHKALSEIRRVLKPGGVFYASTIGFGHMNELQSICDKVDPKIDLALDSVQSAFGLENGAEQLEKYFNSVKLHLYDDYLLVPESKPIVDYIFSTSDSTPLMLDYGPDAFLHVIEEELKTNGPIRITKRTGMFVVS